MMQHNFKIGVIITSLLHLPLMIYSLTMISHLLFSTSCLSSSSDLHYSLLCLFIIDLLLLCVSLPLSLLISFKLPTFYYYYRHLTLALILIVTRMVLALVQRYCNAKVQIQFSKQEKMDPNIIYIWKDDYKVGCTKFVQDWRFNRDFQ